MTRRKPEPDRVRPAGVPWRLALGVSLLWLLGAAATLLGLRQAGGVTTLAVTVILAVPVGFIWAAAIAARMIAELRADLRGHRQSGQ